MSNEYEMSADDYKEISALPGNSVCIDCGSKNTEWGSISFGILFCAPCSGGHRGLGTHISRVRSVKMDSWTAEQLKRMKIGGNQQCKEFFEKHGIDYSKTTIRERYDTEAGDLYRTVLDARMAGLPEPTELPKRATVAVNKPMRKMEGFGSGSVPTQNQGPGRGRIGVPWWARLCCCFRCCLDDAE